MAFANQQYDVVLANPPARAYIEINDRPDYPAIGISYIGNYLEKHTGITPAIIDSLLARLTLEETIEQILSLKPKIVGLSAFTHVVPIAAQIAERLKKSLPDVKVVLGGFHATFLPEKTLEEFPMFDYIVVGEGEMAFTQLVQNIFSGKSCESIQGVWLQKDGIIINNKRGEIPPTLDELGEPGWHLYDQKVIQKYSDLIPVITLRGCPFACNFCSRPYGQTVRKRSPQLVADEIQRNTEKYGIKHIFFYDETFSVNKDHTRELCEEIIKRKLNIRWKCTTHVNTIDKPLTQLMKDSGCYQVMFGVESGNDEILKSMGKNITKERILTAHHYFKEAGVQTRALFIVGHPNETKRSIWDSIKFAIKINADSTAIGVMVPYPGTKVWDLATKGLGGYKSLSVKWDDYNKQLGNAVELEHISRKELEIAQVIGYSLIYLANFRFRDFFHMFKENFRLSMAIVRKIFSGKIAHRPN